LTEIAKRRVRSMAENGILTASPTAPVLAQRLRLTLGQARYIVSALALENPAMSAQARDGLAGRLVEELAKVGTPDPAAVDDTGMARLAADPRELSFDAPRYEGALAAATHEELLNEEFARSQRLNIEGFEPPSIRRRTDSYVRVTVRPHVALAIWRRLSGHRQA
jgi:hypothetical protein